MRTDTPHFGVQTITPPDASIADNKDINSGIFSEKPLDFSSYCSSSNCTRYNLQSYNEDRKMKALICSMGQQKSLFNVQLNIK